MAKAKGARKSGGRAKGTPNKSGADVRAMARAFTKDAITTLAEIMLDDKAPQQARAMAADKLLDRGWGKAAQTIAGDADKGVTINIIRYSDGNQPPAQLEATTVSVRPLALPGNGRQAGPGSLSS